MRIFRTAYLLAFLLMTAGLGPARAQLFEWVKTIRGATDTTTVWPETSTTDATGNTYVAVAMNGQLNVSGTVLNSTASASALVKYSPTGSVLWAKLLSNIQVISLAADNSAGGVFVTAYISSSGAAWDGTPVPIGSATNFYAKCSAVGALQWSTAMPERSIYGYRRDVVADDAGNAYFSGTVGSTSVIGGVQITSAENFIIKVDGAGVLQWVKTLHSNSIYPLANLQLGPKPGGGCLVSGVMANSPLYLGAGTATQLLSGRQYTDGFLSSFDTNGTPQWTTKVGTAAAGAQAYAIIAAAAADANGNCYITGSSSGNLPIGSQVLNNGFFLAKYDVAGALQWARNAQAVSVPGGYSGMGKFLAVDNAGATVLLNTPVLPLTVGTLTLQAPDNLVHFTAAGLAQWNVSETGAQPNAGPQSSYLQATGLGHDVQGALYLQGMPEGLSPTILLGPHTLMGKGLLVARVTTSANTLRGQVYLDQNANGQRDSGEGVFPRQLSGALNQNGGTSYFSVGTDGVLQAYADAGPYSLSLATVPANYTLTQPTTSGAYTGTFAGTNQLADNQDFGLAPTANQTDLRLTLTPYSVARAGLTTRYRLTLDNVGTTIIPAGTATLTLDALAQYVSSTPAGTLAGRTISLSYGALAPFGSVSYDVLFSLPTNTALGAALSTMAAAPVTGDVAPADNTATLAQTVVGPYDPNSMEVNYQRLTPAQVAARQPIDYTIHFQNLGSAPAQNVILSDTLDFQKLNPATLMLVAQSHNCIWSLTSTGPNTGLLTVRFLDINLPEQNADVIRSMGFVRFRVQPRPTLAVGEVIPNHARIVFDYNAAIRTNTAITTVFVANAALASHTAPAWEAYPNPATDVLNVTADLPTAGPVRVELLDLLGRSLRQQTIGAPAGPFRQAVDLRGLAAGVYVLRLTPPTGPALSRQVVRE